MKKTFNVLLAACLTLGTLSFTAFAPGNPKPNTAASSGDVDIWLTTPSKSSAFEKQKEPLKFTKAAVQGTVINIDPGKTFQTIDGFGFCLTGGSAYVINAMPEPQKSELIKDLFSTSDTHIGISYLRISIGASDLNATDFTYDDMPAGQKDENLDKFSIDSDKTDLIPVLKKILAINPKIKILGSPWTAPVWMKINTRGHNGFEGGSLNPAYYNVYAKYLVKYIKAMKAEGITIDAITPQNEPLNPHNNPSMVVQAVEEATFVKASLGPQFKAAGLKTKIIVYDHNADRPDYPLTILKDPEANPYVDGSAFHLYGGKIEALTEVHNAFPNKNLYFTEQWVGGPDNFAKELPWYITNLIVGAPRNWSRNVLLWNLASDPDYRPYNKSGCSTCEGAITVDKAAVTRNLGYYVIAHASKFVRPGAIRVASDEVASMPNVAFKNTDGSMVLIVLNDSAAQQSFSLAIKGKMAQTTLDAGAVATYVWK